jgi:phosphocarrier protein FPr
VGLYRTEFLFMDRSQPPGRDEQLKIYRQALKTAAGRPVVIRTLDIGGDKKIPYLKLPHEENPFLGVRGLRLCLRHPELFTTQIQALWEAAADGPLDVMFPMVTTQDELREAFALIAKAVGSGDAIPRRPGLRWGMMLEIPANLFMIRDFASWVDFFSVGTNDLIQYLTACDRQNPQLLRLSDSFSPAVLRALDLICREVSTTGRDLSVCGEMASDPVLAPFLVGLGVKKLSLNAALIAGLRRQLAERTLADLESTARRALEAGSADEARARLGAAPSASGPTI